MGALLVNTHTRTHTHAHTYTHIHTYSHRHILLPVLSLNTAINTPTQCCQHTLSIVLTPPLTTTNTPSPPLPLTPLPLPPSPSLPLPSPPSPHPLFPSLPLAPPHPPPPLIRSVDHMLAQAGYRTGPSPSNNYNSNNYNSNNYNSNNNLAPSGNGQHHQVTLQQHQQQQQCYDFDRTKRFRADCKGT